ncbi:N-acetylglutamate kinase [Alicyclobacillus hesperidum]|uniref:acetylglutamate kinase n=1 Tax=Alicyclobacillus hesperidum TaxID=89784 RepID=A0A1H2XF31_9BACL|nr:acetylglutamate kinase [Alicyclobacillus hesperidum]SDW91532.1 N-acetylglutamate kinase [Alicyclobacillus hesperidum]
MNVVVKLGGSLDGQGTEALAAALHGALVRGWNPILVHGGGPAITRRLTAYGIQLPFIRGLRATTVEAIDHVVAALQICNSELADALSGEGIPVSPLTDGWTVQARDIGAERTGDVAGIDSSRVREACRHGFVPLLTPFGRDSEGAFYNLNADAVAAHVAQTMNAARLVFLTDVAGVYRNYETGELLMDTTAAELENLLLAGSFTAGMIPKVNAMLYAARQGVGEVWVVDGHDKESVSAAVLDDAANCPRRTGTRLLATVIQKE